MQDRHGFSLTENLKKQRMQAGGIEKAMGRKPTRGSKQARGRKPARGSKQAKGRKTSKRK
jgi:hypothetical protein